MQRIQAEIMWFLWDKIFHFVDWMQATYCDLRHRPIWESPIWDWSLTHIAAEAYYHEVKLGYIKDRLWPPPVAEGE